MSSLHLYSPPYSDCNVGILFNVFCVCFFFISFELFFQIFDERTSRKTNIQMCFHSKYGKKEEAKSLTNVGKADSKREGHVQAA